ncbi:hypothetical protein GLOTRDRAFT_132731 [Gloeophyllum trabeum ATCC 11539]|uniref:Uncharacterized protein n=1 Tax=Gloeophyllum trabeum (strain ATCC 11539 / FP-39264 / Madison 617) TaxID=670483 RepID=S7PX16_GLOTA|nr:uncharacterized protein GLOTRDRAFT_132731 [Gloeophyllum trabeum ATCC 11539]EPQ51922.1 hypothetical protein GLOTRDRAFT_132731 [Gloeophyllum trabeum ATCC 11539]
MSPFSITGCLHHGSTSFPPPGTGPEEAATSPALSPMILVQDLDAGTQETRALPENDPEVQSPAGSPISTPRRLVCPDLD